MQLSSLFSEAALINLFNLFDVKDFCREPVIHVLISINLKCIPSRFGTIFLIAYKDLGSLQPS